MESRSRLSGRKERRSKKQKKENKGTREKVKGLVQKSRKG